MKVLIQRVSSARVTVEKKNIGKIDQGYLLLVGFCNKDAPSQLDYFINKILNLRLFTDDQGKMNLSLLDVEGDLLVVSQFTLYADPNQGRRPSFTDAAAPKQAEELYEEFISRLESELGKRVQTGEFGAHMEVSLTNDGPVTILLEKSL